MEERWDQRLSRVEGESEQIRTSLGGLSERLKALELENEDLRLRCSEAEEQHAKFVNLFVVAQRLSSTLDIREILETIQEIVVNLVGSEQFGIFLVGDDSHPVLMAEVAHEGSPGRRPHPRHPAIQEAMEGRIYVADGLDACPVAAIPLRLERDVIGALVIYGWLPQKCAITDTDLELFELLAGAAAKALCAAAFRERDGDNLSTLVRESLARAARGE